MSTEWPATTPHWKFAAAQTSQDAREEDDKARTEVCKAYLTQALEKSPFADVQFQVSEGVWAASGHRSALSSRSPVFAAMFGNDTKERETGSVDLRDVSAEGLAAFLEFVYLGTCVHVWHRSLARSLHVFKSSLYLGYMLAHEDRRMVAYCVHHATILSGSYPFLSHRNNNTYMPITCMHDKKLLHGG
jgi:hypothetical protein